MKNVGLYFGTFNPIHNGHIALGNFFIKNTDIDEVRFIVSPQNPFKENLRLLAEHHRLKMVQQALKKFPNLTSSDVEFTLSKPSYTVDTLEYLVNNETNVSFVLMMGEDNLVKFDKWKEYKSILKLVDLYVYPRIHRNEIPESLLKHPKINLVSAPQLDYVAQDLRKIIQNGGSIKSSVPESTFKYLKKNNFYK